jgi:hypothetical protein
MENTRSAVLDRNAEHVEAIRHRCLEIVKHGSAQIIGDALDQIRANDLEKWMPRGHPL